MQQVWLALIVGLILGWLIEWIIDWQFWRKTIDALRQDNARLRAELADAQASQTASHMREEAAEHAPVSAAADAVTVVPDEGE